MNNLVRYKSDTRERFMDHVILCKRSGCWRWIGYRDRRGYGRFQVMDGAHKNGYPWRAAAFSMHHFGGHRDFRSPRIEGDKRQVNHQCRTKDCVNPEHLYLGTHADNMRDAVERKEMLSGEGHPHTSCSDADVAWARRQYDAGISQASIAESLSVSQVAVSGWVRGAYRCD